MTDGQQPVVEVRREDGRCLLMLHGELDLVSAPELDEVLVRHAAEDIAVDLEDLTFLDSSGLAVLLQATERRTLELRHPNPIILRVLETTGVLDRFEIAP